MSPNPWEIDVHVRHRQATLLAERRATSAAVGANDRRTLFSRARGRAGICLIALGERLAGREVVAGRRPVRPSVTRLVTARA